MTNRSYLRPFASGVLAANAIPHAYVAAMGATYLTPRRGRDSGSTINALWSAVNLAAALALTGPCPAKGPRARRAITAGAATFAVWALAWEWRTKPRD